MRVTRRLLLVIGAVVLAAGMTPVAGAATFAQKCDGPPPSTQSGRMSFAPGLNHLSVKQQVDVKISLFDCSPARDTRGAGTLRSTITPKGSQTCLLVSAAHVFKATAKITWKDDKTSTLSMSFSLTGATHFMNLKGKVTKGLYKNHSATGQVKYKLVVSPIGHYPNGDGVAQACKNKVAPHKFGRVAISAINLYSTKHFVIA